MAEQAITNTFSGGINQDVDFILQPDGTYRNMKNGMLISMDGHSYTVEISNGNKVINTLPIRYKDFNPRTGMVTYDKAPMPIGFLSFIDELVVFSTNNTSDKGGYGEIGVMRFSKLQNGFTSTYTPYYHHPDLKFSKFHKIEGFSFRENNNIKRSYFTDNNNEPRVFDIANPIFTTYINPIGGISSTAGTKYMVLSGIVEYDGVLYGPCDGTGVNLTTNIFESNGTDFDFTVQTSSATVIEYYPLELLDWSPSRLMGDISFDEYGSGAKNYGSSMYFYRLYSENAGYYTSWSYGSSPIHIGGTNYSQYLAYNTYKDFVGYGTDTTTVSSEKSIKLKISNIDTNFDIIEVCCMEFDQKKDVPNSIKIIAKASITGSEMSIEDKGTTNLGTVTLSDLTLFPTTILKAKTLTTDKNYNLVANLTEREEFNLDLSGASLTQFEYPMLAHFSLDNCANGNVYTDVSADVNNNPSPTTVPPYTNWIVTFGNLTTDTVIYNGVNYVTGDVIKTTYTSIPNPNADTIYFTGAAQARPATSRNFYTVSNPSSPDFGKRRENAIQLKTGFWDYKDPAVASHNKGYWSNELYRIGLLFYDKKGNPFYTKWIGDIGFSSVYDKGGLMTMSNIGSEDAYFLNPSAINVSGLDIPQSIMDSVSGFSIVRAERDKRIVTQGLLMQNQIVVGTDTVYPIPTTRSSDIPSQNNLFNYYHSCLCPDWLVAYNKSATNIDNNDIGYANQYIEEAFWLDGTQVKAYNGDLHNLTTKMFTTLSNDSQYPRLRKLQSFLGGGSAALPEEAGTPDIDGVGHDYFNKYCNAEANIWNTWDYNCTTSGSNFTGGLMVQTIGCKKLLIKADIPHYNASYEYGDQSGLNNYSKLFINFLSGTSRESQYGGNTKSAIANTLYISTGHFQPINDAVKADTLNGVFTSGEYAGQNKYTFNDIEVFGGDCYTNLIDLGYGLWSDTLNASFNVMSYSLFFPCEGNSNYGLRNGLKVSNKDMYPNGLMGWETPLNPPVALEGFSYNKAYSSEGTLIKYPALPLNYSFTNDFEYRVRYAGVKYPGEVVDSFRRFLINDYKDLDGQSGEINNIRAKDGRVLVWQNHALNSVPILERQLLSATNGAATTIGTGGVVDRFDPITSYFGNQHQHGLTKTEYGFIWFDMRNRALCVVDMSNGFKEISLAKGLQAFFNNEFNEGDDTSLTPTDIYNTNNYTKPELPLMGYGIVGVYDPRYKMSYLTFKYADDKLIDLENEIISITAKDFTIGYSHVANAIVGFYDFTPGIWHNHNDLVLSSNNSKNYVYYGAGMDQTTFNVGDVIKVTDPNNLKDGEYVCIQSVTIDTYPPTNPSLNPLFDNTHWTFINKESEIYVQTFNTEYCKFYGKVYDHEIEVIVNPKVEGGVSFLKIQQKSNDNNYDSIYCSTDNQTASDVNIRSTDRNYRYIDKSWFSSLPLPSNGRLTDHYVKIKFVLKNYITNPTIAKNKNKIFQFLQTWFVGKR